jgi:hypothetical protein
MSVEVATAEEAKTELGMAEGRRFYAGLILLLLALAASLASLLLFGPSRRSAFYCSP